MGGSFLIRLAVDKTDVVVLQDRTDVVVLLDRTDVVVLLDRTDVVVLLVPFLSYGQPDPLAKPSII